MTEREKTFQEAYETEIVEAWREQLAEAAENPWLADLILRYGDRILGRFIAFYQRLRRLPHKTLWRIRLRLGLSIGGAALLLALSGIGLRFAQAGTVDEVDTVQELIDAITWANGNTEADRIVLVPGTTFSLNSVHNTVYGDTGLPVISSTITIQGNDATIQRLAGQPDFRILAVGAEGKLTLQDTIITGGYASGDAGGGIYSSGALTITGCSVLSNTADFFGGGVFNYNGTAVIRETVVSGNSAEGGGGLSSFGYYAETAHMAITDSVISGNYGYFGGGVFNLGFYGAAGLRVSGTTISRNESYWGGGIGNLATGDFIDSDGLEESTPPGIESDVIRGAAAPGGAIREAVESGLVRGGDASLSRRVTERRLDLTTVPMVTSSHRGHGTVLSGALSEVETLDRQALANGPIDSRAEVRIETSVITGNSAFFGGGAYNSGVFSGTAGLTIVDSTVSGNYGFVGGGVGNTGAWYAYEESDYRGLGTVTVTNSTVSGNEANLGGGLSNGFPASFGIGDWQYYGGGTSLVDIEHSTISGNEAWVGGGVLNVEYSPEYGVSKVSLRHAIVSGNRSLDDDGYGGQELYNLYGRIYANDYNLFGDASEDHYAAFVGFVPSGTDIDATQAPTGTNVALNRILDPVLRDNGGRTKTHALVFGSPAIDAGDRAFAPPPYFDQRGSGYPRVVNRRIDIGAYEYQSAPVGVGGVTVGRGWFSVLSSRVSLLLGGLVATLGTLAAALGWRAAARSTGDP